MKLTTVRYQGIEVPALIDATWNAPHAGRALLLNHCVDWPAGISTVQAIIENFDSVRDSIARYSQSQADDAWIALQHIDLCAPIPVPVRNIICLGWNYAEHAKESSAAKDIQIDELPKHPIVFTKATTTVNAPFGDVIYDERVTRRLDWEVELGVVIGKRARHVSREDALSYVFGYTVINDLSARDLQKRHQQFFLGKSVDGTCPMGPWIVTADDIPQPQQLHLYCKVNGDVKQDANTDQQIFPVAEVIATLSNVMTLLPGDIIATGTPSGVGFARTPPEYLAAGDIVECAVEQVGIIRNRIV